MQNPSTTRMSSKGQVVIPEEVRDRLGLKAGMKFVVVAEGDVVILKTLSTPSMEQFGELIAKARSQAKESGLKRSDISKALKKVRKSH